MLHTQNYLRNGHSLQDLYQQFDIGYNISSDLGICVLNYRAIADTTNPLVRECRALFLEMETWNVVCKSIDAFYDYNDPNSDQIWGSFDWNSAIAQEKLDGALVCMFYYRDQWRIGTRTDADGSGFAGSGFSPLSNGESWETLTRKTISDMGFSWEVFTAQLDPDLYYIFELCGPELRVGVIYEQRFLALVAAVRAVDLQEINIYTQLDFPVWKASILKVNSWPDVDALIQSNNEPYEHEGYVLLDQFFHRIKVKNPRWVKMMNQVEPKSDLESIVHLMNGSHHNYTFVNTISILSRIMTLAKYVSDGYHAGQAPEGDAPFSAQSIDIIWPEARHALDRGLSMSDFLDTVSEDNILAALQRFEALPQSQ